AGTITEPNRPPDPPPELRHATAAMPLHLARRGRRTRRFTRPAGARSRTSQSCFAHRKATAARRDSAQPRPVARDAAVAVRARTVAVAASPAVPATRQIL